MSVKHTALFNRDRGKQRGAALMVMLVIMIMGAAAILVSTLSSSALKLARDNTTADALVQAKNALIGRAVADSNSPGSLPCPDLVTNNPGPTGVINVPDDGIADSLAGNDCPSYIGRLPWKTLGLPDLRDGSGERLWYALSPNFRDDNSNHINSDSQGTLGISGTAAASGVIAIVFAPGGVLSGQNRSTTPAACTTLGSTVADNLCATNYLEGSNANLSTAASPNTTYQSAATSSTFNDRMIIISHDQLFQPVETRIAREAKNCLDAYASASANKYPWAAPVTDTSNIGSYTTLFGRISGTPNIDTSSGSGVSASDKATMTNALNDLLAALNTYIANQTASNKTALFNAGINVINLQNLISSPPAPLGYSSKIDDAGDWGRDIGNKPSSFSNPTNFNSATTAINTAQSSTSSLAVSTDTTMSTSWSAGCFVPGSYWNSWTNLVFYQVASGYQPGGSGTGCGANCLSISGTGYTTAGSGTYRATVLVARDAISSAQATGRTTNPNTDPPSAYLEGVNPHTGATPATSFVTNSPSSTNYKTVNDLVLCLDGKNNCK